MIPLINAEEDGWACLRPSVLGRDGGCMAPQLDPDAGECSGRLTLDHVKEELAMGAKAPDDEAHLVTLCLFHHVETSAGANWATSHRTLLRRYLSGLYPDTWAGREGSRG